MIISAGPYKGIGSEMDTPQVLSHDSLEADSLAVWK